MKFAIVDQGADRWCSYIAEQISQALINNGCCSVQADKGVKFTLNLIDVDRPKIIHRRNKDTFVVSITTIKQPKSDIKALSYSTLVRSLSNLMICIKPPEDVKPPSNGKKPEIYFTTPEVGFYHYPFDAERVCKSMLPLVSSRLAIENRLEPDLPAKYWRTSPIVKQFRQYARELDQLGVLPTPFPLKEFLPAKDIDYLYRLFGITGLSYGNLSARERITELSDNAFWMTARGVNKAKVEHIGSDILMVKDYDQETGVIVVSVPPEYNHKARVSVDAVEHHLIYQTYSDVGAVVHVHAWMDGVISTRQNYPCGTRELAEEVVDILRRTENPAQAVIGLKNHGLTITGIDLEDIFQRIRGKLKPEVPMFE